MSITRYQIVQQRIAEELARRQAEINDPTLTALTIVIKMDARTREPGQIAWRPEYHRSLNGARPSV